jgi:hypothetical protein
MTYHIPLLIAAIVLGWVAYELIYGREIRRRKFKPQRIAQYGNDPRKIGADRYGDDRSENIKLKFWRR